MKLTIVILSFFFSGILLADSPRERDTTNTVGLEDTTAFVMAKAPWKSLLFSAVFPGTGQIYNQSYWKAPVVWGCAGWFTYNYIQNNKEYKKNRDAFIQTASPLDKRLREFYHDQRDLFAVYLGITYVLNLVDAYVDAHLFDFTVNPSGKDKVVSFKYYFSR